MLCFIKGGTYFKKSKGIQGRRKRKNLQQHKTKLLKISPICSQEKSSANDRSLNWSKMLAIHTKSRAVLLNKKSYIYIHS